MHSSQAIAVSWLLSTLVTPQPGVAAEMTGSTETADKSWTLDNDVRDEGFEWLLSLEAERTSPLNLGEKIVHDQRDFVTAIELSWRRALNTRLSANAAFSLEHRTASADDTQPIRNDSGLVLDELFLSWRSPETIAPQLSAGRLERQERSQWWWDDTLDGVAIDGGTQGARYQLMIGEQAQDIDTFDEPRDVEEREITRTLLALEFYPDALTAIDVLFAHAYDRSGHLALGTMIDENHFDEFDSQLSWIGVNLNHRVLDTARTNIDIVGTGALLRGRDERQSALHDEEAEAAQDSDIEDSDDIVADEQSEGMGSLDDATEVITAGAIDSLRVDAWAFDLALQIQVIQGWEPLVTFQYAVGSGSRGADAFESALFRQTGLEGHDDGASRYGLLYAPQLGNIAISAVSIELHPLPWMTVTARYLDFYRRSLASAIGETEINIDTSAPSKELGQESVLRVGIDVTESLTLSATGAYFTAGRAYGLSNNVRRHGVWLTLELEF